MAHPKWLIAISFNLHQLHISAASTMFSCIFQVPFNLLLLIILNTRNLVDAALADFSRIIRVVLPASAKICGSC